MHGRVCREGGVGVRRFVCAGWRCASGKPLPPAGLIDDSTRPVLSAVVRRCRAGRPGTVISLISGGERFVVEKLGRRLGVSISEVEVSHGEALERLEQEEQREGQHQERREREAQHQERRQMRRREQGRAEAAGAGVE